MSNKNNNPNANPIKDEDKTGTQRKKDHIELSLKAITKATELDNRFYYEPMLSGFPGPDVNKTAFLGKTFDAPIWISSMTGGTGYASIINKNLAKACGEYHLGMGLGSCRSLLFSDEYLSDFDVRQYIGDQPLYANLGIAQIEQLIRHNELSVVSELIKKLQADGLIVHVNPLQEYLQPEGDKILTAPIETIKRLLDVADFKIIVKEVGQGMGIESLRALLSLPIEALDFAAFGGTNFSKLEQMRGEHTINPVSYVGHTAEDMVEMVNQLVNEGESINCNQLIISGGVTNYLDGYYLINKSTLPAIYGQASPFLQHATGSYEVLQSHIESQLASLGLAKTYLTIKK